MSTTSTGASSARGSMVKRNKRLGYLPKVLRLSAFVSFVALVVVFFAARAVADNLHEGMLALGREMMRYTDGHTLAEARTLELNGAPIEFATGSTDDAVGHVLDVYEQRCAEHGGGVGDQLAHIAEQGARAGTPGSRAPTTDERTRLQRLSTLRTEHDGAGFVACLDVGRTQLSASDILARVRSFAATGNVADVGRMRYLYAERASSGRTRMIAFWSDRDVNVKRMFPRDGDAPGREVANVPHPPGLRRLLNAAEVGHPYSLSVFAGATPRAQLEEFYRHEMLRNGWTLIPMRGGRPDLQGATMLTYEREQRTVSLVVDGSGEGRTTLSMLEAM